MKNKPMQIFLGFAVIMVGVWAGVESEATMLDQSAIDADGVYNGAHFALSNPGFNLTGDPLEQTNLLTSVGFRRSTGGGTQTTGPLYLKVFTGSTGGLGTFVGASSNTVDFFSLSNGATGTWSFGGLILDKDSVYSYVIGDSNDSSNPTATFRIFVNTANPLPGAGIVLNPDTPGVDDPVIFVTAVGVPEPTTATLLIMVVAGTVLRARSRRA